MLAATFPIWQASRMPVRETLLEYGIQQSSFGIGLIDRILSGPSFSRPFRLALRNSFRKKGRLLLTVSVLATGAALFMASFNLESTMQSQVEDESRAKGWGVAFRVNRNIQTDDIQRALEAIPDVRTIEPFRLFGGTMLDTRGEKVLSLPITVLAPSSSMLRAPLLQGRWLVEDERDIVINQAVQQKLPSVKIGDGVRILENGQPQTFRICGIVKMLGSEHAYIQETTRNAEAGLNHGANGFFLIGANFEREYLNDLKNRIERLLQEEGIELSGIATSWEGLEVVEDHFEIIFNLTLVLTFIVIIIGGNGIILTMTSNIVERTREIGVIKAIGASRGVMFKMILVEGLVIGLLSWVCGVVLTLPLSSLIAYSLGKVLINVPLQLVLSPYAFFTSLLFMLIVTTVSCLSPAYRTAKRPAWEALLYE
jgi:putative ABC transport system permease protein